MLRTWRNEKYVVRSQEGRSSRPSLYRVSLTETKPSKEGPGGGCQHSGYTATVQISKWHSIQIYRGPEKFRGLWDYCLDPIDVSSILRVSEDCSAG